MKIIHAIALGFVALTAAACATGHAGKQSLAEYCANPKKADTDLCKVNADIVGVRGEAASARTLAQQGVDAAARAQSTADAALARQDGIYCETRTLHRVSEGSCSTGYTLVGCAQSRYTTRSGGPTIMRDMNDQRCRFATRVLELKVRCCMVGAQAAPVEPVVEPEQPRRTTSSTRTS